MKLQQIMLGLGLGVLVFGAIGMITFSNNITAALINGFFIGIIVSAIINMVVIKFHK